jgi:hypothetical protein
MSKVTISNGNTFTGNTPIDSNFIHAKDDIRINYCRIVQSINPHTSMNNIISTDGVVNMNYNWWGNNLPDTKHGDGPVLVIGTFQSHKTYFPYAAFYLHRLEADDDPSADVLELPSWKLEISCGGDEPTLYDAQDEIRLEECPLTSSKQVGDDPPNPETDYDRADIIQVDNQKHELVYYPIPDPVPEERTAYFVMERIIHGG